MRKRCGILLLIAAATLPGCAMLGGGVEEEAPVEDRGEPSAPADTRQAEPAPAQPSTGRAVVALLDDAHGHTRAGRHAAAAAALERALRIEPRNPRIWQQLAQVRLEEAHWAQAANLAAKSNSLATGNLRLQARNWRIIAAARRGLGDEAGARKAEDRARALGGP